MGRSVNKMTKKRLIIIILIIVAFVAACVMVARLFRSDDDINTDNTVASNINSNNEISSSQSEGNLGMQQCLSKFRVEKGVEYSGKPEILELNSSRFFDSGAFFGQIKDYQLEQNKQFAAGINQLMREQKIRTYRHLRADVCLYEQDLFNPQNGATLNYYVEHYYCTNSCQTGQFEIRVDLNADGDFVGYDIGKIY